MQSEVTKALSLLFCQLRGGRSQKVIVHRSSSFLIDGLFCCLSVCLLRALIRDSCSIHSVTQCLFMWFSAIFKNKIEVSLYLRENVFLKNTNCASNALIPNDPLDICETCMCIYVVSYTTYCVALHWNRYYKRICNICIKDVLTSKFINKSYFHQIANFYSLLSNATVCRSNVKKLNQIRKNKRDLE
jgi:hypothetical protein